MGEEDPLLVLCTCPEAESAARIARALVEEHLAACVNRLPGLASTYRWRGTVHDDHEVLLLIKTRTALFDEAMARIKELHPYTVPQIVALPFTAGNPDYFRWLGESTAS